MTDKNAFFITSYGRKIDFVPGYIDYVERMIGLSNKASDDLVHASINAAGGHEKLDYEEVDKRFRTTKKSLSLRGYGVRLARFCQFLDLLNNTSIRRPFKRALDIGCGFGIQPRIMRALGIAEETTGIDIYDRCSSIDENNLKKQHRRLRWLRGLELIERYVEHIPPESRSDLHRAILEKMRSPRNQFKVVHGWMPNKEFYSLKYVREPKLDKYIIGDIFELDGKFDLITAYSSFPWFEARAILRKVSDLLDVGGVLYVWVPNWWCSLNVTRLAGHFPYACQRLSKEDYFRYLEDFLPGHAEAMKRKYEWFDPSHPTLSDYIEIGYENGLIALDHKSYEQPDSFNTRVGITPLGHLSINGLVLHDILEDIHEFRPDIRLTDLLPFTHAILFQKIDKQAKLDAEALQKITQQIEFHYRPTNPVMRKARELAVRFYLNK